MVEALIVDLGLIFVAAGALLLVANQFRLPTVPFYLLAGIAIGWTIGTDDLLVLAQWGIAFLVFVFGIRLDLGDISSVLRDGEVAAITQLLVVAPVAFGVGYLFAELYGFADPLRNAIYFAAAVTLSSTIVGAGLLETEIRDNLVHGRLASSIHFFDDLVAIGLVLILSTEALTGDAVAAKIGYGVLLLLAAVVIYRHGFPLLVRATDGSDELVLMGSVSILVAFLAAAEYLGISIVVGAFAAGVAIRNDETQSLSVRNGIDSIRDFFVTIFFVTIGALVSIPTLEMATIALALVALVVLVNPVVLLLAFVYEGYDTRTAFLATSGLNQVSEFSLIIAIQAVIVTETIAEPMFDAIILAAAVTMLLTAFVRRREDEFYATIVSRFFTEQRTRKVDEGSRVDDDLTDHVIVLGYGRQGRRLVETLEDLDQPYVVVENDPVFHDRLEAECQQYVFGDAMSAYPWEKARVADAALVVSTVDHRPVSEFVLELETDADVILRSDDVEEAEALLEAGATYVTVPDILAGEQLVEVIETLLEDDTGRTDLRADHLDRLAELERYGFATQRERY
ncbi:cation:proton antiporter [Natrononativus amylolyticus]|uniref:cation:proton antiporter n=1 Tax=Natrononativus amylolyticus TaxID=2963434 RepID=UPI0020CDD0B1|nr:cation:proton antiporter [Natrononativus amylolyticus]